MERHNFHEDISTFKEKEKQKYFDAFRTLSQKITIANDSFGGIVEHIEHSGGIPAHMTEKFLLWPIEEIEVFIQSVQLEKNNMPLALALRDALVEKIDNVMN